MSSIDNPCSDQDSFNTAFRHAIESNKKYNEKKFKWSHFFYTIIWLICFMWSLILINKNVAIKENRVVHVAIAMICPPIYVLSSYVGLAKQE